LRKNVTLLWGQEKINGVVYILNSCFSNMKLLHQWSIRLDQCCLVIWSHVTLWILASYWRIVCSFTQKVSLFFLFDISKICMFVYQEVWWHSMFFLQTRLYVWLGLLKIIGWEFLWGSVQSSPTVDCWFYGTKVSPSTNFCWVHQYEFELVQHCLVGAIITYELFSDLDIFIFQTVILLSCLNPDVFGFQANFFIFDFES
jgi:hypothetical protein